MTSSVESSKSLTTSPPQCQCQDPTSSVFRMFLDFIFYGLFEHSFIFNFSSHVLGAQ